jgi:3-oxosteroid 1-dehydrogenase
VVADASPAFAERRWEHEVDVAVVGSGAAAASAALFAHDAGAKVTILEKAVGEGERGSDKGIFR